MKQIRLTPFQVIFACLVLIIGVSSSFYLGMRYGKNVQQMSDITNFDECARAGYPILQTYPAQCIIPGPGGKTFTQGITPSPLPAAMETPQLFSAFLQQVTNAQYSEYAQLPTTKVQTAQDFEEMRNYILNFYASKQIASTYMTENGYWDCVSVTPNHANPPAAANPPGTSGISSSNRETNGFAGTQTTQAPCKAGTFPMKRITLEILARFPTVQAFLGKSPDGKEGLPPTQ